MTKKPKKQQVKKPPVKKAHALDIFDVLHAVDHRDFNFLERQPEDKREAFTPIPVLRWASATTRADLAESALWLVNEYANFDYLEIADHPELQFKLLAAAGLGQTVRREWLPMPKKSKAAGFGRLSEFMLRWWPGCSDQEINILLSQYTRETFNDFLNDCGLEKTETKDLLAAWDSRAKAGHP